MKTLINILLTAILLAPMMAFSQSNDKGTIQISADVGFNCGFGATNILTGESSDYSYFDESGVFYGGSVGVGAQFGLIKRISLGIAINRNYLYYNDLSSEIDVTDIRIASWAIEFIPRFYIANKDRMNFYVYPAVGFITGIATVEMPVTYTDQYGNELYTSYRPYDVDMSGVIYGFGCGFNFYFGENAGLGIDIGYKGTFQSGDNLPYYYYNSYYYNPSSNFSNYGVQVGLTGIVKFGSKK
jgi:hypothetical protein